ncbi:MAG TPA: GNAT family protein [Candidatus Paceibacterota bacterium]|nr:GNAT family protein [Candidatus Paceibacterota bacterium]
MELKTKRLILRKAKKSDWKDIMEGARDLNVSKNMTTVPHPYEKEDANWFINDSIKKWNKKTGYSFFIELKSERKVIGVMTIGGINEFTGTATTGSWINKKYWKQGYMTEAKIAVNDFAFNKLGLRRLNSSVFRDNKASNATQLKMGYKLEGTSRKAVKTKSTGKIHDINIYGLLKEDWKKTRLKIIKKHK